MRIYETAACPVALEAHSCSLIQLDLRRVETIEEFEIFARQISDLGAERVDVLRGDVARHRPAEYFAQQVEGIRKPLRNADETHLLKARLRALQQLVKGFGDRQGIELFLELETRDLMRRQAHRDRRRIEGCADRSKLKIHDRRLRPFVAQVRAE